MTHLEKTLELKDTIQFLYEKDGRTKSYIAKLLFIERKVLSKQINDWGFVRDNSRRLKPSNKKFLNKHENFILKRLNNDITVKNIAKELGVKDHYLLATIIPASEKLQKALDDKKTRIHNKALEKIETFKRKSYLNYEFKELEGEEWKEVLGYKGFYVSNKGRIKSKKETYKSYCLLSPYPNVRNNRLYIKIKDKNIQVARLVAFAFCEGHSQINNTVNHIDGNILNNNADNLEWVSQSENQKKAFELGRVKPQSYSKYGNFKKIILNGKYEFKTIKALAKFIQKSETQTRRYIDEECYSDYKFEFIY